MGNHCGDLALYAGIASGAEIIVTPELRPADEEIFAYLKKLKANDADRRAIMVVSEKH